MSDELNTTNSSRDTSTLEIVESNKITDQIQSTTKKTSNLISYDRDFNNPKKQAKNLEERLKRKLNINEQIEALIGKNHAEILDILLNNIHTYKDLFDNISEIQKILHLQDLHIGIIPGPSVQYIEEYQNLVKEFVLSKNNTNVTLYLNENQESHFTKKMEGADNKTKIEMRNTDQLLADIYITSKLLPKDNLKEVGPIVDKVISNLGLSIISTLKNIRNSYLNSHQ